LGESPVRRNYSASTPRGRTGTSSLRTVIFSSCVSSAPASFADDLRSRSLSVRSVSDSNWTLMKNPSLFRFRPEALLRTGTSSDRIHLQEVREGDEIAQRAKPAEVDVALGDVDPEVVADPHDEGHEGERLHPEILPKLEPRIQGQPPVVGLRILE